MGASKFLIVERASDSLSDTSSHRHVTLRMLFISCNSDIFKKYTNKHILPVHRTCFVNNKKNNLISIVNMFCPKLLVLLCTFAQLNLILNTCRVYYFKDTF